MYESAVGEFSDVKSTPIDWRGFPANNNVIWDSGFCDEFLTIFSIIDKNLEEQSRNNYDLELQSGNKNLVPIFLIPVSVFIGFGFKCVKSDSKVWIKLNFSSVISSFFFFFNFTDYCG